MGRTQYSVTTLLVSARVGIGSNPAPRSVVDRYLHQPGVR